MKAREESLILSPMHLMQRAREWMDVEITSEYQLEHRFKCSVYLSFSHYVSFKPVALIIIIVIFCDIQGCGKTSTIKAIAAHTHRHLIEIPLSRIRTCAELTRIFHMNFYEDIALGFTDKVIVFEDIDCMATIIQKRELSSKTEPIPYTEQSQTYSKDFLRDLLGNYQKILSDMSAVIYYGVISFQVKMKPTTAMRPMIHSLLLSCWTWLTESSSNRVAFWLWRQIMWTELIRLLFVLDASISDTNSKNAPEVLSIKSSHISLTNNTVRRVPRWMWVNW